MSDSEEERRPRPIGVADDSEDSDVERGNNTPAAASAQAGDGPAIETTGVAAPEDGTAKKPSRKMPAFSENDLVKEKGLRQIYKDFPRKCRYKGKGREAEFLRGLMVAYKEWGYQLYPGAAFEDLASRTEKLGGKARTRDLMRELRDTERDRVIEAKYGRAAVEDLRAQEAAKLAAKESKTAAAREEAAEEQEDEELASSRYMEVDGGGGAAASGAEAEAASAAVISEQVRQRMEVNRRLALERLRKKKEEAAAALEKENDHDTAGVVAVFQGDNDGAKLTDPMDVDDGDAGAAGDDVDDDEAALADIEPEAEARAEETVAETGAGKSADAAAAAAVASTPRAPTPSAVTTGAADNALLDEAHTEATSSEKSSERREDQATGDHNNEASEDVADRYPRGVVDPGRQGEAGQSVERGDGDGALAGANGAASNVPGPTAEEDSGSGAPPALPPGKTAPAEPASGEETDRAPGQGTGKTQRSASEAAAAMPVDETAGGSDPTAGNVRGDGDDAAAKPASTRRDEHATFNSPVKGKATGGLPLSPLGNLFASTDVSAEGGTAAVRAPLAGLFSDKNA